MSGLTISEWIDALLGCGGCLLLPLHVQPACELAVTKPVMQELLVDVGHLNPEEDCCRAHACNDGQGGAELPVHGGNLEPEEDGRRSHASPNQ